MAAAARRLVEAIASDHGYLGEEAYEGMSPEKRRTFQEAFLKKDQMIGASIITLAKNLYSKDVRFLFELLQNAEDNHFTRAASLGAVPYVSFDVYKDRIVLECNEDGFTEENLRAICNVGHSSKTGAQGYIGEKGIGFKSVFKVAWKVHIQSGEFSFTFTHHPGESGMGMVSPVWQQPIEPCAAPMTRTTLFLHDNNVTDENAQRHNILRELNEFQPAMLLFLKKLKKIKIRIYDDSGNETSSSLLSMNVSDQVFRPVLEKVRTSDGTTAHSKQKYHVVKSTARNLPRNENREYSTMEQASKAYSCAPVILAFPISEFDVPVIKPQEVFAFLPVRRVGFNFLIHSDFVTQANREDIVTSSSRNIRLLDALTETFIIAMRQLCLHPTLKYQWMRYLPKLSGYPWDSFWQNLVDKIKTRISDEEILVLGDNLSLRRVNQARRLLPMQKDQYDNPLLGDLPGDMACYISSHYKSEDMDILKEYGLSYLLQSEFLGRVERDLSNHMSKIRSIKSDDDWHSRVARHLNLSFEKKWENFIKRTKAMSLIPLLGGQWVSPTRSAVYFAHTPGGLPIPADLGLLLLDPVAAGLPMRNTLFTHLGVQFATVDDIRTKILRLDQSPTLNGMKFEPSLSHLRFLYLTHTPKDSALAYSKMSLCDNDENLYSISEHIFYCRDKASHDLTWESWLHTYLGVRQYPRLINHDASALSEECQFVAKHLPSELLGFLKYSWDSEGSRVTPERIEDFKALKVTCRGDQIAALNETYLPLPALLEKWDELRRHGEVFPFLNLGDNAGQLSGWDFLRTFGVNANPDLGFYLDILFYIQDESMRSRTLVDPTRLMHLYLRIYTESFEFSNDDVRKAKQTKIRDFFEYEDGIYLPSRENFDDSWVSPSKCILDGPTYMLTKYPVFPSYQVAFEKSNFSLPSLKKFLHDTLRLQPCSWIQIVDELEDLKLRDNTPSNVQGLYKYLNDMTIPENALKKMKEAFENKPLIFADVGSQRWHKLPQCLWSAPTSIRGKINLSAIYDSNMEKLFVEKLGVRLLDANVVYNELLELDLNKATVEHIKNLVWTLNSQLEIGIPDASAETLLQRCILPARDISGEVSLHPSTAEFAIIDRKDLGEIFGSRVKWAGLEHRYISQLVKETSVLYSGDKAPISDPTRDVSKKAYGLLRIATHFKSPRVKGDGQELYDLLRNMGTWETDKISTTLVVTVDGQTVTEEVDKGEIHIEDADGLDIYVPHDEGRQDDCYLYSLPNRLVRWLMTDTETDIHKGNYLDATLLIHGVIFAKSLQQVERFLKKTGVIEVSIPEQVDRENTTTSTLEVTVTEHVSRENYSTADQMTPILASTPTAVEPSTPRREGSPFSNPRTPLFDREDIFVEQETPATDIPSCYSLSPSPARTRTTLTRESLSPDPYITRPSSTQESISLDSHITRAYRALLSQVISKAKTSRVLSIEIDHLSLPDDPIRTFNEYDLFGVDTAQSERDRMVGAAGELFVFELLSAMDPCPGAFGRSNWTSTIRRYATVLTEYANMPTWRGREISDLQYKDDDGTLTEALMEKGHLEDRWRNSQPKYYIEVKTTPGSWDTPFYMSHAQWQKMQALSTDNSLYIIFRVYNLYSDRIGVDIYVDPHRLADEGHLFFTADKWTVKPLVRAR
ncbi:hypothetical protein F4804DRAFT_345801 [Jackrogersella minutella]|nr:hypothetical protein F4804DRAFT_345801 [Jackrogersella minutella]